MYSCGAFHMDQRRFDDQVESIYNSSVPIQVVAWKTCRWTIEMDGKRGLGKSVLVARDDDDKILTSKNQLFCLTEVLREKWIYAFPKSISVKWI